MARQKYSTTQKSLGTYGLKLVLIPRIAKIWEAFFENIDKNIKWSNYLHTDLVKRRIYWMKIWNIYFIHPNRISRSVWSNCKIIHSLTYICVNTYSCDKMHMRRSANKKRLPHRALSFLPIHSRVTLSQSKDYTK